MGLNKLLSRRFSSPTHQKNPLCSYLALVLFWIVANIYSELMEELSFWLETGFAIAQWLVLQRYFRQIGGWILLSVVGWMIAFVLISVVDVGQWIVVMFPKGELAIGAATIGIQILCTRSTIRLLEWVIIGCCQWLVLRRHSHIYHAGWWILASALGGAIKGPVEYLVRVLTENTYSPELASLVGGITGSLGYGIVTSVSLILLLKERI